VGTVELTGNRNLDLTRWALPQLYLFVEDADLDLPGAVAAGEIRLRSTTTAGMAVDSLVPEAA